MPSESAFAPDRLAELARAARAHAYAPYSGFQVGAALQVQSGEIFSAANVENASYGLSICAERAAATAAIAAGKRAFAALAVCGPDGSAAAPCGACRQFLSEFNPQLPVTYATAAGFVTATLDTLLPAAFGPGDLT